MWRLWQMSSPLCDHWWPPKVRFPERTETLRWGVRLAAIVLPLVRARSPLRPLPAALARLAPVHIPAQSDTPRPHRVRSPFHRDAPRAPNCVPNCNNCPVVESRKLPAPVRHKLPPQRQRATGHTHNSHPRCRSALPPRASQQSPAAAAMPRIGRPIRAGRGARIMQTKTSSDEPPGLDRIADACRKIAPFTQDESRQLASRRASALGVSAGGAGCWMPAGG